MLSFEVPTRVATLHESVHHITQKADDDFLAS